jgi:hypothetical protein
MAFNKENTNIGFDQVHVCINISLFSFFALTLHNGRRNEPLCHYGICEPLWQKTKKKPSKQDKIMKKFSKIFVVLFIHLLMFFSFRWRMYKYKYCEV